MTSVLNLVIVSFTSTVEPGNHPWWCYCQDFHLLSLKFQQTLTLSLSTQTFSAQQIRECSISQLELMLMVCQNSSINIASFIRLSLTSFNLHITLHQFLFLSVLYITSYTHNYFVPCSTLTYFILSTCCDSKVMRLATLCTNRQCCCCLPLHMEVRLTPCRRLGTSLNLLQLKRDC